MDATVVRSPGSSSVASSNIDQKIEKLETCATPKSPNYSLHSASNKILRSGDLALWREFILFRSSQRSITSASGLENICDDDATFNNYLPPDKMIDLDTTPSSRSAGRVTLRQDGDSPSFGSQKNYISPASYESVRKNISPHSQTSCIKDAFSPRFSL